MSNEIASIQLPKDMVKGIVEQQIKAAIIRELGGESDKIIERIAHMALAQKVDSNGAPQSYGSTTLIEYLCHKSVREAVQEALKDFLKDNQPKIKEAILKEFKRPETQKAMAESYVSSLLVSANSGWSFSAKIEVKK